MGRCQAHRILLTFIIIIQLMQIISAPATAGLENIIFIYYVNRTWVTKYKNKHTKTYIRHWAVQIKSIAWVISA